MFGAMERLLLAALMQRNQGDSRQSIACYAFALEADDCKQDQS